MRAEELRALLDRRPFKPIRLHITSGEHVDIYHPEMALVSRSLVAIALPSQKKIAELIVHYNLIHVVKIQPINGGGSKGRGARN